MIWQLITQSLFWSCGYTLFLFLVAFAILFYLIYKPLYYVTVIFFFFCIWFFRNPVRTCPALSYDHTVIVSPSDGKVVEIDFDVQDMDGFSQKVSIALSLFDAHITWAPIDGYIKKINYVPGSCVPIWLPKSSLLNEHNDIYISSGVHRMVMVRQIAGFIARRICNFVTCEHAVRACQPLGMIRFGSRVEVFLPPHVEIMVGQGQLIVGGQTVLAKWIR